jgi:hypothetical protein
METVKAHVFGKGLGKADGLARLDKVADGHRVPRDVAGREALVGHVEEAEELTLATGLSNLDPLFGLKLEF